MSAGALKVGLLSYADMIFSLTIIKMFYRNKFNLISLHTRGIAQETVAYSSRAVISGCVSQIMIQRGVLY